MSNEIKEAVRERYAAAANRVAGGDRATPVSGLPADELTLVGSGCCDSGGNCSVSGGLYSTAELSELPDSAVAASLGCGNPTALATLHPGETVLDLGSGGGIDVLLSAKRVGSTGKAYGLDMTDEMLALARRNQAAAGVTNVEFLKGEIEAIPLPESSVDVIISNCVINLSADKDQVFREAFRVLRPGGRLAVSDVVFLGDVAAIPDAVRRDLAVWAGCVGGALGAGEYQDRLRAVGFGEVSLEVTREYTGGEIDCCSSSLELPAGIKPASAFVRAVKPSP